jgi:hypothetical protein
MFAMGLSLCAASAGAGAADRRNPTPAQIESWAACAVEKNADEVKWMYVILSDQSGLQGQPRDGATNYAIFLLSRACVPEGTSFDNELMTGLSTKAIELWNGDVGKHSLARSIDAWADCMADSHPQKSRAYLFARDFSSGGPKIIVEGVDPIEAFFAPTEECQALAPARDSADLIDLYARLNYRLRVEPRFQTPVASAAAGVSDA